MSSTGLPSAPPDLLTRSSAILAPVRAYLPLSAPRPVTDTTIPILIVSPPARAMGEKADVARPTSAMFMVRLVSLMHSSRGDRAFFPCLQRAIGNSGINPLLRNLDRRAAERPQF